jgi:hypothetical protein
MPVPFPAIEPATRSFVQGGYPATWTDHRGFQHVGRLWGSVGGDAQLDLTFEYLQNSETQALIDAFDNALSGYIAMTLPEQLTCGILDEDYAARIRSAGLAYSWFMPEPPRIRSRSGGLSDASCALVGRLESI